jgi:hypothetical protein
VLVVTCAEPDAVPFLLGRPVAELEQTLLLATRDVVRSAELKTAVGQTCVMAGAETFSDVRDALGRAHGSLTVVVGPDPWGPIHGKGFVRARQILPSLLPDLPVDVIELEEGGRRGRVRAGVRRAAFARWVRRREAREFLLHMLRLGAGHTRGLGSGRVLLAGAQLLVSPVTVLVTLARVVPYVARTEARVRRSGGRG